MPFSVFFCKQIIFGFKAQHIDLEFYVDIKRVLYSDQQAMKNIHNYSGQYFPCSDFDQQKQLRFHPYVFSSILRFTAKYANHLLNEHIYYIYVSYCIIAVQIQIEICWSSDMEDFTCCDEATTTLQ